MNKRNQKIKGYVEAEQTIVHGLVRPTNADVVKVMLPNVKDTSMIVSWPAQWHIERANFPPEFIHSGSILKYFILVFHWPTLHIQSRQLSEDNLCRVPPSEP